MPQYAVMPPPSPTAKEHSEKKGLNLNIKKTEIMDVKNCLEPLKHIMKKYER